MGKLNQGDLWWISDGLPFGSEPGYRRPWVVIQNDRANATRLKTAVSCPLTTNLRRAGLPGNVLLNVGEGQLKQPSVVSVSQVMAVDLDRFDEYIGMLSRTRLNQIIAGLMLLVAPEAP